MIEFLSASQNLPFVVALVVMGVIALLEGVGLVMGMGLSSVLDSILPDIDLDLDVDADVDVDVDVDVDGGGLHGHELAGGVLTNLLGWLRVGRVPILVLATIFLGAFGSIGLTIQSILDATLGMLPGLLVVVPTFILSLPLVRIGGGIYAAIIPDDETSAVPKASFVGSVAVISTSSTARRGFPAQAKLKDAFGETHYIMVEPAEDAHVFEGGSEVLLTEQRGSLFAGIPAPDLEESE